MGDLHAAVHAGAPAVAGDQAGACCANALHAAMPDTAKPYNSSTCTAAACQAPAPAALGSSAMGQVVVVGLALPGPLVRTVLPQCAAYSTHVEHTQTHCACVRGMRGLHRDRPCTEARHPSLRNQTQSVRGTSHTTRTTHRVVINCSRRRKTKSPVLQARQFSSSVAMQIALEMLSSIQRE